MFGIRIPSLQRLSGVWMFSPKFLELFAGDDAHNNYTLIPLWEQVLFLKEREKNVISCLSCKSCLMQNSVSGCNSLVDFVFELYVPVQ